MAEPQDLPPLAVPIWDPGLTLLSQRWLGCARANQYHRFNTGDSTAFAVHRARKDVYRRCASEVKAYEDAIRSKNAELQRLRAALAAKDRAFCTAPTHGLKPEFFAFCEIEGDAP
jgi:hypothetical protein